MRSEERRLKIAVLVRHFVTSGGMERYAVEIARRLRDRGHEIHIFGREVDEDLAQGMIVHRVPRGPDFSSSISALAFARDCARLLEGCSFDIIHSHEKGCCCHHVLTLHTFSFKGSLGDYSFLRRIDQKFLSYRSWLYLYLERKQLGARRLVAVSELVRKDMADHFHRADQVDVVEPGVDTDYFNPARIAEERGIIREKYCVGADEMLVLFVGSEFKRKGLDRLIMALQAGMRLLVVGRGEKLGRFKKMADAAGVGGQITFAGLVEDVGQYYAAADVVVLPSRKEAFGMTVLEGMAFGLPVVVSREVGAASLIRHGEDGFVFDGSVQLGSILIDLTDEEKRKAIAVAARARAEEYTWERQADKYERIFWELSSEKDDFRSQISQITSADRA